MSRACDSKRHYRRSIYSQCVRSRDPRRRRCNISYWPRSASLFWARWRCLAHQRTRIPVLLMAAAGGPSTLELPVLPGAAQVPRQRGRAALHQQERAVLTERRRLVPAARQRLVAAVRQRLVPAVRRRLVLRPEGAAMGVGAAPGQLPEIFGAVSRIRRSRAPVAATPRR